MDLTVKTAATATSIDAALVKQNRRILHNSEDALIGFWIKAADAYIEKRTNRALMQQTLVLRVHRILPVIQLPRPPLASITHVKYAIRGGAEQTLAEYGQRMDRMLHTIDTGLIGQEGVMEIEYVAGAAQPEEVPAPLRQASLLLASHYVTSREAAHMDARLMQVEKKTVFGVDQLVAEYRVPNATALNGGW